MQIPPPDAATFDPVAPLRLAATAVRRAWPRMLAFFAAVMGLAFVGLVFAPREYGSDAKLFVRVGRESIGLDPTATTGQTFSLQESRKTEINSVLDVITTREVFERTAERVGPRVILEQGGWSPVGAGLGLLKAATGGSDDLDPEMEAIALREQAVKALSQSFDVDNAESSSVIDISCRADSPELAQAIMTEFLDAFQGVYLEMFRSGGSYEFFEEQAALLSERHQTAGDRLRDAKDAIQAASVEGRRAALQNQIDQLDDRLLVALAERDGKTAERDALKKAIAGLIGGTDAEGAEAAVASGAADDAADALRKQVDGLRMREQELLTRFTEQHPEVIAVRDRLAGAEAMLAAAREPGDPSALSTNPTLQGLHLRSLEEQAAGEALDRRIATLQSQQKELLSELRDLNAREAEIDRLQRETDLLAAKYGEYTERLEQARMNRALAEDRITNVNVAQRPTLVLKPVSPNKPVVLILSFLLACGGAVALGLLSVLPSASTAVGAVEAAERDPVTFEPDADAQPRPHPSERLAAATNGVTNGSSRSRNLSDAAPHSRPNRIPASSPHSMVDSAADVRTDLPR